MEFLSQIFCAAIVCILGLNFTVCVSTNCTITFQSKELVRAECSNRGFTHVPRNLSNKITSLYLNGNNLSRIKNGELIQYNKLEFLTINNNNLSVLEPNCFAGLRYLRDLYLAGNALDISSYPGAVFSPVSNLTYLDISKNMEGNILTPVIYPSALIRLKNLRDLYIDLMPTPVFNESYRELTQLKRLVFDNCFILKLTNETFKALPGSITELQMLKCETFFHIEADALRHFPKLQTLDLSHSRIHIKQALKTLYPLQHKTMQAIIFHRVTFASIMEYDYDVVLTKEMMKYISTICIETLDISDNNIVAITDKSLISFEHPECFRNLILSANRFRIEQFAIDFLALIQKMVKLEIFDFSYLPLEFKNPAFLSTEKLSSHKIDTNDMNYQLSGTIRPIRIVTLPKQLQTVRLTHIMANNHVEVVQMFNCSLIKLDVSFYDSRTFPYFEVRGENHLTHLDLSGIKAVMTIGKFPTLEKLFYLKMTSAKLYDIIDTNMTLFSWTPNIQYLDISQNFIWYLDFHTLGNLTSLRDLNLSNNMFKVFPAALRQYPNINLLDLSFNLLTTLDETSRNWMDSRNIPNDTPFNLFLTGNAFVCSCETAGFISWLFTTKVVLDKDGNYSCRTPNGIMNYTANVYKDYHHYFSNCNSSVWLKISLSFLATTIILIVVITVMYNFRWHIIFFLSRKFRKLVEKKLNINFLYDVYVSYHGDGASFVKNELQPKLENEWGLQICCKDRDFIGGEAVADAITDSINRSRSVIFVVTQSFKDDEWKNFEIDRAKYEKCTKNLQNIVVIVKDISSKDITTKLADISQDVYIIEWPKYEEGLAFFWKRLRLCLQLIVID